MKKTRNVILFILSIAFAICLLCTVTYAHSGKTDSNGGHYNSETGEYHYHHGYPEHQHNNGICPYDYDDKTSENSKSSTSNNKQDNIKPVFLIIFSIILLIVKIISICKKFLMYENISLKESITITIIVYIIMTIIVLIELKIDNSQILYAPFISLFIINIPEILTILSTIIISAFFLLVSIPSGIKSIILKISKNK